MSTDYRQYIENLCRVYRIGERSTVSQLIVFELFSSQTYIVSTDSTFRTCVGFAGSVRDPQSVYLKPVLSMPSQRRTYSQLEVFELRLALRAQLGQTLNVSD